MKEKQKNTILGISIWRIFFYFIIYSFLGYIIETIFGVITTGKLECRQSFLYGPFLGIYGLGGCILIITVLLAIDCLLTAYAQEKFIIRMVVENNIKVENLEEYKKEYENTYNNKYLSKVIYSLWGNEKMIKTFPNIKIEDINENTIYLSSLLPNIQSYYVKIFDKNN